LLRVDPEPRFLTPSLKTGLGAAERVNLIPYENYENGLLCLGKDARLV
jgi:hypothetical protein